MRQAAKTVLLLGVLICCVARVAAAQRLWDSVGSEAEVRAPAPTGESLPPIPSVQNVSGARGLLAQGGAWMHATRAEHEARSARQVLGRILPGATGFAFRDNGQLRGQRRLNRKLLPIPLLRWQRPMPLGPRGQIALNPSLVIGRRQTFMASLFPGGRTFGVAVEMRVRFDGPPTSGAPSGSAARDPRSIVLSSVRGFLDRNR